MKKLVILSISFLIICSCEKNNQIIDPITNGIFFYPVEIFKDDNSVSPPDLKLHFISTNYCSNGGCRLIYSKSIKQNELIIIFEGIQKYSSISIEPHAPDAYIDLPEFINKISLINGNETDQYKVLISKEKIEIDSLVKNFTDIIYDKIFRYPENTFNFTCWTDSTDTNLCSDYLNMLFNELSLVEYVFNGEGKIPFPYFTSTSPNHHVAVFKYEKESDYDRAGELLKEFTLERIPQNEGKSISLFGWNNKIFFSWTFY